MGPPLISSFEATLPEALVDRVTTSVKRRTKNEGSIPTVTRHGMATG